MRPDSPPLARALPPLLLGLIGFAGPAAAQDYQGARLLGFGGARRALGTTTEALFSNPAGLVFGKVYDLELGYADSFRETDRRLGLAVADGQAGSFAGGVALTYGRFSPPDDIGGEGLLEGLRFDTAIGIPIGASFAVGFQTRYMDHNRIEAGPEAVGSSGLGFDLGLLWMIFDGLAVGATVKNFTDQPQPGIPRAWGAGLGYQNGPFNVEVNVDHEWERADPTYALSAGAIIADRVPLRVGVGFEPDGEQVTLSVGTGLQMSQIGLDLAYRQIVNPRQDGPDADNRIFMASVRVTVF